VKLSGQQGGTVKFLTIHWNQHTYKHKLTNSDSKDNV